MKQRADELGLQCTLKIYPDMPHVFVVYPMPDANEAKSEIIDLVKE